MMLVHNRVLSAVVPKSKQFLRKFADCIFLQLALLIAIKW